MILLERLYPDKAVVSEDGMRYEIAVSHIITEERLYEGMVLVRNGDAYNVDKAASEERKKYILRLQDELFE